MGLKDVSDSIREVFGNKKYVFLALFVALAFYYLNVLINGFSQLMFFYNTNGLLSSIGFFFRLGIGLEKTIIHASFATLVAISILIGILFSMIWYRTEKLRNASGGKAGFFATIGIFLGIIVPGCAACGIGLISAFGFGAAFLNLLPWKGLEISLIAIAILAASIFIVSKDIKKGIICEI